MLWLRKIAVYWKVIVLIVTPLILLPIPVKLPDAIPTLDGEFDPYLIAKCIYVVLIMAVYWVTEVLPLTVTALIPLAAFPFLQIAPAKSVANSYIHDISFLFLGGLIFAGAVEETNLHRRIALRVLLIAGSETRWLMAGIMVVTAFLSMWISNTATTAMMLPVVLAIAMELIKAQRKEDTTGSHRNSMGPRTDSYMEAVDMNNLSQATANSDGKEMTLEDPLEFINPKNLSNKELNLVKGLLLAISYSASLGGTATLTGTLPNVVMTGLLTKYYGSDQPVNYATWMGYNFPGMLINITIAWFWLQLLFLGFKKTFSRKQSGAKISGFTRILRAEITKLGSISFGEVSVIFLFSILLLLWFTRGTLWTKLFQKKELVCKKDCSPSLKTVSYVSDGTCAMMMALLLFIWPKQTPDFQSFFSKTELPKSRQPILTWEAAERHVPWGVILLLGGGFALGQAVTDCGLAKLIGIELQNLQVSRAGLLLVCLIMMTYTTEFTSNTATSNLVLPIIIKLAERLCINPLYLALPTAEAASFAFMLPVATPPNAIVFTSGVLKVKDMVVAGFLMNIVCICEVLLSINTWGWAMFGLGAFPDWIGPEPIAACQNMTLYLNHTMT